MSILQILQFPDPKLKLVAKHVKDFNGDLMEIYKNMVDTMYEEEGIGLAATQVDICLRLFVLDVSSDNTKPLCFINPEITASEGEFIGEEGCLSFPGVYAKIARHKNVTVQFYNLQGKPQELEANGMLSICIQHEIDHLNGITFFDHLSQLKKKMLTKKLAKMRVQES